MYVCMYAYAYRRSICMTYHINPWWCAVSETSEFLRYHG